MHHTKKTLTSDLKNFYLKMVQNGPKTEIQKQKQHHILNSSKFDQLEVKNIEVQTKWVRKKQKKHHLRNNNKFVQLDLQNMQTKSKKFVQQNIKQKRMYYLARLLEIPLNKYSCMGNSEIRCNNFFF